MIPLMMQKDYSPKGWLGMILGTRMWYAMWDAEKDDAASFDRRLDSVVREVGDRGKPMMAEAVPPEPTPAPAPAAPAVRARRLPRCCLGESRKDKAGLKAYTVHALSTLCSPSVVRMSYAYPNRTSARVHISDQLDSPSMPMAAPPRRGARTSFGLYSWRKLVL